MAFNVDLGRISKSVTTDGILKVEVQNASVTVAYPTGVSAVGSNRRVVNTPGTAIQLQNNPSKMVIITAETDNTGNIFVGDSSVNSAAGSERGFVLYTGQTSAPLPVSNTNLLWIDATVATDGVAYSFFT